MLRSKYDSMIVLREMRSRSPRACSRCGETIPARETPHREELTDRTINFVGN